MTLTRFTLIAFYAIYHRMSLKSDTKRGIALCKYGTRAASTRQRCLQALPYLAAQQITLDIHPLFDNDYLTQMLTHGRRSPLAVFSAYCKRLAILLRCRHYDFIWVQYELFPYLPGFIERCIGLTRLPVIYDIDDAFFHQYDQHHHPLIRRALGRKLIPLMQRSRLAFCGNAYLHRYVHPHCPQAEIIPTVLDTQRYMPAPQRSVASPPILGWIGSPSTWKYCLPVTDLLTRLVREQRMVMHVIGAEHAANPHDPFTFRAWSEASEIAEIQQMDIGIMPLPDEPWARGKCGYKLIQYMACGLPVIASPVGVNSDLVQHGVNGFLATTEAQWREAIDALLADPALRQRMGDAGRAHVVEHYSIQRYGPHIASRIRAVL